MQIPISASVIANVQAYPAWLKGAARATLLLLVITGAVWLGASWLALRGFSAL